MGVTQTVTRKSEVENARHTTDVLATWLKTQLNVETRLYHVSGVDVDGCAACSIIITAAMMHRRVLLALDELRRHDVRRRRRHCEELFDERATDWV